MSVAYIGTSALVAIQFNEYGSEILIQILAQYSEVVSSNLLEAELRSACARENHELSKSLLDLIDWVLPDRPLTDELIKVLNAGYLQGADLLHVATALYVASNADEVVSPPLISDKRMSQVNLDFVLSPTIKI